jgi:uncharacterized SAM-binding protein YcdF (DUF218 family)
VLVEDKSTNCGANAIESRKVLEANGIPVPASILVVQDPTMSLRTIASFQRAFQDFKTPPRFFACPTFVPTMCERDGELVYDVPGVEGGRLWHVRRFLDLIIGEVPRLRDDEMGYGPRGKGFIAHVDLPEEVEEAWRRLKGVMGELKRG